MANRITNTKPSTSFVWMIENFSYWCSEVYGDCICSPQFSCSGSVIETFSLGLFPNGIFMGDTPFRVQLLPHGKFPVFVADCVLSYQDFNGLTVVAITARDMTIQCNESFFMPLATTEEVLRIRNLPSSPTGVLPLKFEIFKTKENGFERHESLGKTRFKMQKTNYIWPTNFFKQYANTQMADIPIFQNMFQRTFASLKCMIVGVGLQYVSPIVCLEALRLDSGTKLLVLFEICLVNERMEMVEYFEEKCVFHKSNYAYNFQLPSFVTRRYQKRLNHCQFSISVFISSGICEEMETTTIYRYGCGPESLQSSTNNQWDFNLSRLPIKDT